MNASAARPTASPPADTRPAPSTERRQLTVVFCDLVGSTALSARLDPEDLRDIIAAYHRCCAAQITKHGGFVAQYMGDGVLSYFGYPQAHEDDVERALRAALLLIEAVPRLRTGEKAALQVRVGIATGLVVVGDLIGEGAAREQGVVGETPNVAARLQALAGPGQVVISQATRRLAGGLFEYRDLGPVALKGLAEAVHAYQVLGESAVESRFEARHETSLTPIVGRDEELELVWRRWRQVVSGEGRVVVVSGEPGIGKSRLAVALNERLQDEPHTSLRYFCSPHHTDSAFYPVITHFERAARFGRHDAAEAKLAKLEGVLGRSVDNDAEDSVALIADLLSLPTAARARLSELTPQRRKEKTLAALMVQLEMLAGQRPVLMIFEDVHWIDPTSLELLTLTVERAPQLRLLLLITTRPEFNPPWPAYAQVTTLPLTRLSRQHAAIVVGRITGGKTLPGEVLNQILARTDGVPLFVEELTKATLEIGILREHQDRYVSDAPLPMLAIPTTLHDSLMARLDRLATVREIAQLAAAIGREFSYELLSASAGQSEDKLKDALAQLVRAELLFCRGTPPQAVYTFKHALVRDAAYGSLLRGQRHLLNARIVSSLEAHFPDIVETQPELLAQHCVEAGFIAKASVYWLKAGQRAAQRSASTEAVAHFTKGIEALANLPDTTQRERQELTFRLALGPVLIATRGWNSVDAEASYERALALCDRVGDAQERFDALWGLWLTRSGMLKLAREVLGQLSATAAELGNDAFRLQAHHAGWATLLWLGELSAARDHFSKGLGIYDPIKHRDHAFRYGGHDPGVCGKGQGSLALWMLGYPDQAARSAEDGIALGETLRHAPSLAHSLMWKCAVCDVPRRDSASARRYSERLMALADEQGLAMYASVGGMIHGWALVHEGSTVEGFSGLRRGFASYCQTSKLFRPYFGAVVADAYLVGGEATLALDVLQASLQLSEETQEVFWQAEMLHLQGKLLLLAGRVSDAEGNYRKALDLAVGQNARSLQLRAATSLARLWRDQSKRTEARGLLAPIYDWFTEGFDTADLNDAKTVLETLA